MWVFIRPRVVRSANEEKVKRGQRCCPIHRFDGNDQLLDLFRTDMHNAISEASNSGRASLWVSVRWKTVELI